MKEWVFFLEELSARAMLEGLLPRIAPQPADIRYIVFERETGHGEATGEKDAQLSQY